MLLLRIAIIKNSFILVRNLQDYYTRQLELLSTRKRDQRRITGILIHFVVAGQTTDFRTLESKSTGPIDVMPVHVEDVFREDVHI